LINTGWSGGPFGIGRRISLPYTRAMIRMALEAKILTSGFRIEPVFGLQIPNEVDGVPSEILEPVNTWQDKESYYLTASGLIEKMRNRMERFASRLDPGIIQAGPKI